MACFDDVVALKELCDEVTPFSGTYLNDIGITRSFIESVITSDYTDIQDFVDSKIRHAGAVIAASVHGRYGSKIQTTSLIHDHRLGYPKDNLPVQTGGNHRGIQITLNNYAQFVNLELSQVSLHTNYNGTIPILVYDLYQNKLLETINVTAVTGQVATVFPHTLIPAQAKPLNLFIGYDSTGINSYTTYIRENQCCGVTSCTTSFMTSKGVTNSTGTFIAEDMVGINHTSGLSIVYSLHCDPLAWMCAYARVFALPMAYKIGSEMYLHGIQNAMNERSSNNTNLNIELMRETQQFYEMRFREELDSILGSMNLPKDNACIQCKPPARTAIAMP